MKYKPPRGPSREELFARATELGITHLKTGAKKAEIQEAINEAESELKKLDPSSNIIF